VKKTFLFSGLVLMTSGALGACGSKSKVAPPATEPFVLSASPDLDAAADAAAASDEDAGSPEKPAEKQFIDALPTEFRLELTHPSQGGNWKAVIEQNGQVFIRVHREDASAPVSETCSMKTISKEDVTKLIAVVKKNRFFTLLETYPGTPDGNPRILHARLDGKDKKVTEGFLAKPKHDKLARDRVHFDAVDAAVVAITGDWRVTDAAPQLCTAEIASHLDIDGPVAVLAEK
jgi:hypothetical protein